MAKVAARRWPGSSTQQVMSARGERGNNRVRAWHQQARREQAAVRGAGA